MSDDILTVGELIRALERFPPNAQVRGTWESTINTIYVYQAKDGVVLVDADGCFYQREFESGERETDV